MLHELEHQEMPCGSKMTASRCKRKPHLFLQCKIIISKLFQLSRLIRLPLEKYTQVLYHKRQICIWQSKFRNFQQHIMIFSMSMGLRRDWVQSIAAMNALNPWQMRSSRAQGLVQWTNSFLAQVVSRVHMSSKTCIYPWRTGCFNCIWCEILVINQGFDLLAHHSVLHSRAARLLPDQQNTFDLCVFLKMWIDNLWGQVIRKCTQTLQHTNVLIQLCCSAWTKNPHRWESDILSIRLLFINLQIIVAESRDLISYWLLWRHPPGYTNHATLLMTSGVEGQVHK